MLLLVVGSYFVLNLVILVYPVGTTVRLKFLLLKFTTKVLLLN